MKKSLSFVLSLLMILATLTALPFTAHAYTGTYNKNTDWGRLYYDVNSNGDAVITDYSISVFSFAENVTIPSVLDGHNVVEIGYAAFQENETIQSVTLPDTVVTVNSYAFNLCSNLSSVTLSSNLKTIGIAAFGSTAITGITIPSTTKNILDNAFEFCENLTSINIPNNVNKLKTATFMGCTALTTVNIGSGVSEIALDAFDGCTKLTAINVNSSNANYSSSGTGNLYNKDKSVLILYPLGKTQTAINFETFSNNLTTIGDYAFDGNTHINYITLTDNITTIGTCAFRNCSNLNQINIPDSVTAIGDDAFTSVSSTITVSSNCDHPLVKEKVIQNIATRTWEKTHGSYDSGSVTTPPTCTENGVRSYKCVKCGEVRYTEPVPANGHSPSAAIVENEVLATCTEDGTYDEVVYCGICEAELSRTPKIEIAKGHAPGKPIKIISTPATYDKVGYYDLIVYCSVCDAELSREEDIEIPKLKKTSLVKATVSGIVNKTYTGKNTSQKITVKLGGKTLVEGKDYKVSLKNCANVGTATLTVSGIKAYSGTIKKTYKINPKNTTLSKVTAGKKAFTAKWKKQTKQTTGYELQYSTNKSFKKGNKTVKITKNKTVSKTVKKLNAKKKYYVRIRTYKTVKGTKYCSSWSKAKTVTTKK